MFVFSLEYMKDACRIIEDWMDIYLYVKTVEIQRALNQILKGHVIIISLNKWPGWLLMLDLITIKEDKVQLD
jgi:hypothetical protein